MTQYLNFSPSAVDNSRLYCYLNQSIYSNLMKCNDLLGESRKMDEESVVIAVEFSTLRRVGCAVVSC